MPELDFQPFKNVMSDSRLGFYCGHCKMRAAEMSAVWP